MRSDPVVDSVQALSRQPLPQDRGRSDQVNVLGKIINPGVPDKKYGKSVYGVFLFLSCVEFIVTTKPSLEL